MHPGEDSNNFLLELLALQQDGRLAISAPTNWTTYEPLLEVETETDKIIDELQESLLKGEGNDTARWHFFIGSPGNGKSAAMGKLCRKLISKGCHVCDERDIPISELEPNTIPYAINVYEGNNKFASVQIVQDASVVRSPFSADIDPAAELLETIKSAWAKGVSLVVCTNRGVLEKAHRDFHMNGDINSTPWFKVVTSVVSINNPTTTMIDTTWKLEGKKSVFQQIRVGYSHLDNRSLLLNKDTFAQLFLKATLESKWTSCASCSAHSLCPFKANRDWLANENSSRQVLLLLERAEVMSGQVIVFREALAIISLILAGCPRDYESIHPCDWVRKKVRSHDIFSLATRRIYMSLFVSFSPYGLEVDGKLRLQQLEAFRGLHDAISECNQLVHSAIRQVVEDSPPSTDVGVVRLLGEKGIINSLDPCREALPSEFYDKWDSDFDAVPMDNNICFTEIELNCLLIWKEMEESLELTADHSVSKANWALRRWSSNFLLHFGALVEGRSSWSDELDRFASLLGLVTKPLKDRSIEEKLSIKQLDIKLESLLNMATTDQSSTTIPLSESVTLAGQWVKEKLKPKIVGSEASGSVSLSIQFAKGETAVFAAPMYLWLSRRVEGRLDPRCFPRELISGVADARVRAAAKGMYAFVENDVELIVNTGKGELFRLNRIDSEVNVTHE
jgi:hypothetical protein